MDGFNEKSMAEHKLWKKVLCVFLSIIIAFGTFVTLTVGSGRLQDLLGIQSMLSAYAAEIVDTKGAVAVDEESMLANNHIIDLENRDGSNTVYLFSEPISYTDENGNLKTKDISVEKQRDKELKDKGYEFANGQNDYRINFSADSDKGLLIRFEDYTYSIIPQGTSYSEGKKNTSAFLNENFDVFEYENIYGEGTNLKFYPQLNGVKDEIVLNSNIGQNVFSFELKTENCTAVLNDSGTISLINKDNNEVQSFQAPFAYDCEYISGVNDEHYSSCKYDLEEISQGNYLLSITVDSDWLNADTTSYPVIIDPTTSHISNMYDLPIHTKRTTTGATVDNNAVGTSTELGTSRTLVKFQKPSEIKAYAKINSAYYWTRELTGRTSNFTCGIYKISSSWNENNVWSTRPTYNGTQITARNINSASTDSATNPHWYKFNITSLVQQWYTGTTNYGFMMKYENETAATKNLRTFAQQEYSASYCQPYTVINYTNDTTAPTVTSVTGNPTSWTNNNVTLTINGAADNSGGAGLHATPYSFSTTQGTYSWQAGNTKTFSSNCTVYVYVRDALGNIRLVSTQTINKIDKTKTSAPTITGNAAEWTNGNVTLSASSSDSQSGIAAYSFSTTESSYSWQTEKNKTYSENTTVYVYSKDNAGNISAATKVVIGKIDKSAPSKPIVTGNTENWTNNDIELTAQSTDNQSGVLSYSFSSEAGKYDWQNENTKIVSDYSKIYVYSKDIAGNISEPCEMDLKIDKLSPTGTVSYDKYNSWVKNVTLTADAADDVSGLHQQAYSFSTVRDEYQWQTENSKTITANGTIYIYVRDAADNITLLDTVTLDNIDSKAPTVNDVNFDDVENKTVITIDASDEQSGVAEYSIDNGATWQTDNVFEIEKDSLNYVRVRVRDNVGNSTNSLSNYYYIYTPQVYYENNKIGLYNPNPNCENEIYYKFSIMGAWTKYEKPFPVSENQKNIYVSFDKASGIYKGTPLTIEHNANKFAYTESATDFSLNYNSVSFDIKRAYNNDKWEFSFDSSLSVDENGVLIRVRTPDFSDLVFLKSNKYLYYSESSDDKLSVIYNHDDTEIAEYVLHCDNINYHYDASGRLSKISNAYGEIFSFTKNDNCVIIKDAKNRETVLSFENGLLASLTDANGGVINYDYSGNNLVKVTDQADVILGEYKYSNGRLSKSNDITILYDTEGRVVEYLKDNGYSTKMEYGTRDVTITTSDNQTSKISYNIYGNISSSTDTSGETTTYTYDNRQNLVKAEKADEILTECTYDSNDALLSKKDSSGTIYYYYDDKNNVIRTKQSFTDTEKSDIITYYAYDENGKAILQAEYDDDISNAPEQYDETFKYKSVSKYTYENGLLIKSEDVDNSTVTIYLYDDYGNNIKSTTKIQNDDGTESIGIAEDTYDILNRLVLSKSNDKETSYVYDAAGRTLLVKADGEYSRTVYDNHGRVIQEIDNSDYNPELDNLPYAYTDSTAGHTYTYAQNGNLVSEVNKFGIETEYTYSDTGAVSKKHFDIYDYYYLPDGKCDKVEVSGKTIVDYDYDTTDESITLESGQSLNRVTYADGNVDLQIVDKNGAVVKRYNNGQSYYETLPTAVENTFKYGNSRADTITTITSKDNVNTILKTTFGLSITQSYQVSTHDDYVAINEQHFAKSFTTGIYQDSISFTSDYGKIDVSYNKDENTEDVTQTIKNGENTLLSSSYVYDEENDRFEKSYGDASFYVQYDNDGNIISDERNTYTYGEYGQLATVSGDSNSAYTYDERGNILTKTDNGETTSFTYANSEWKDQLTKVNDTDITYDANGNMVSYGDTQYTWDYGKSLSSVKGDGKSYYYKYDEYGIRTSKTVNGKTTRFNTLGGTVLAQSDSSGVMYFQYDSAGAPIGFVYNDIQYLYITNISGDIAGITDAQGNPIAEYSYDAWGKLLDITTAEEGNEEQLSLANANPLRYRGYYYDNETGYYYLQSRYYNPEWGRFISADGFAYLDTQNGFSLNAYIYCWDCPTIFEDAEGTTPTISIDISKIQAFVVKIQVFTSNVKNKLTEFGNRILASLQDTIDRCKQLNEKIKCKFTALGEKIKFKLHNFNISINKAFKEITGRDLNIFKIVEFIIERVHNDENDEQSTSVRRAKSKTSENSDKNNVTMAVFQGLFGGIILNTINNVFNAIHIDLEDLMNKSIKNNWYGLFKELMFTGVSVLSAGSVILKDYFQIANMFEKGYNGFFDWMKEEAWKSGDLDAFDKGSSFLSVMSILSAFISFSESMDNAGNGALSKNADITLACVKLVFNLIAPFVNINPALAILLSFAGDIIPRVIAMRVEGIVVC